MALTPMGLGGGIGSIIDIGASIFGAVEQGQAEANKFKAEQQLFTLQEQENVIRGQAMALVAARTMSQQARAANAAAMTGIAQAAGQGVSFGGAAGGQGSQGRAIQGSAVSSAGINVLSTSQGLMQGQQMLALQTQEDQQKIAIAQAETQESQAQGISSIAKAFGGGLGNLLQLGAGIGMFAI